MAYGLIFPKASTIRLRNFSDPIVCHGRTASYLTAPAQIPACRTTALGSSEILASLWPICFPVYASSNGYPF